MAHRLLQTRNHLRGSPVLEPHIRNKPPYTVNEVPLGTTIKIRIITIGAGASGLNVARTLRKQLTNYEHIVYEKNPEVGGTWYENRYPGCKCDIPSHNYQFSYKPNKEWVSFFSTSKEIEGYLCSLYTEENMHTVVKVQHEVIGAVWNDAAATWKVQIHDLKTMSTFEDECDFLLNASGILNDWQWPAIPGLQEFKGILVHSASWNSDVNLAGKTVAVIGNGSSGVQIVPAIQPEVKQLIHYIREPTWIVPPRIRALEVSKAAGILSDIEYDDDENFSPAQIQKFKDDPVLYKKFVKAVEEQVNSSFWVTLRDTEISKNATEAVIEYMKEELGDDPTLCEALIPKFPLGCRRMTPGVGYLPSLLKPNVTVRLGSITRITPTGLVDTSGEEIQVDAIVCATGFNVSFRPRFPIIGRKGNLQDIWKTDQPKAYMSCAIPDVPNYFIFLGPNAPIGHGSVFTITEIISKYIIDVIKKCQEEGIRAISPRPDAAEELYEHTQAFMPRTAWAGSCSSWFKNGSVDGPVTALHPGSRIHFIHMLQRFRGEDWAYEYRNKGNRFSYLGNGISIKELDGSDPTWYLDEDN